MHSIENHGRVYPDPAEMSLATISRCVFFQEQGWEKTDMAEIKSQ